MENTSKLLKTVMHEIKKRKVSVKNIEMINPRIKKITFTGDDLKDFVSLSPDDHVKVFLPSGEMRDYTPMRFNNEDKELELAFYLHGNGPASQWAINAKIGDELVVAGPRGSQIVPYSFDWYLMIGDETNIPSMLRRIAEIPAYSKIVLIIEVESENETAPLTNAENVQIIWSYRNNNQLSSGHRMIEILKSLNKPEGNFFTWVSLENRETIKVKEFLENEFTQNIDWIKARGYWARRSNEVEN